MRFERIVWLQRRQMLGSREGVRSKTIAAIEMGLLFLIFAKMRPPIGLGPLNVDLDNYEDGSIPPLILNEYSWTKKSNIIYLDQPVGTGFSYATTSEASYSNDTLSAKFTYDFIRKWLINHPRYLKNPLYICGDSYSGIWVPLVAKEVYNGIEARTEPVMNMKGYILGSPHSDSFLDLNGRIPYANRMGLLSDELYQSAKVHCQGNFVDVNTKNVLCQDVLERVNQCVETVCRSHILEPACKWGSKQNVSSWHMSPEENFLRSVVPTKRFTCRMMTYSTCSTWANHKSVQKALHIREGTIGEWERCNHTIEFNLVGPSGNITYINDIQSAIPYHQDLIDKRCRAFIYSGDHDMVVPHTITKEWIDSLKLSTKSYWRPWFVEDSQVAGYTLTYANKDYELTFATVKGAGHVPPEYKKSECFDMFSRWLDQSPL